MNPAMRAFSLFLPSGLVSFTLACTQPTTAAPPRADQVCESEPGPYAGPPPPHEPATARGAQILDMDAVKSIPIATPDPWWTCELSPTTIACARHEDCELVYAPCRCACSRVVRANAGERRRAKRELATTCELADTQCETCEQPISASACDHGTCVGISHVLHMIY